MTKYKDIDIDKDFKNYRWNNKVGLKKCKENVDMLELGLRAFRSSPEETLSFFSADEEKYFWDGDDQKRIKKRIDCLDKVGWSDFCLEKTEIEMMFKDNEYWNCADAAIKMHERL